MTREPAWDEDSRQAAYAAWTMELEECPQCKGPRSECSEPKPYYPATEVCYRQAALDVAHRKWTDTYEKAKPDRAGFLPSDGASICVTTEDRTPGLSWPSGKPVGDPLHS